MHIPRLNAGINHAKGMKNYHSVCLIRCQPVDNHDGGGGALCANAYKHAYHNGDGVYYNDGTHHADYVYYNDGTHCGDDHTYHVSYYYTALDMHADSTHDYYYDHVSQPLP
ncbi:hypothetical protein [Methyloprofundus sedimenti]|uniref:hypothetical protein n=1 Tax=Methyloprofundus sedimenti TaxID=1420851 RepID=UPI00117D4F9D|nr:hypothetical protein [Methyloprofundus sedimenti]